jgi:hypothetical protein
MSWSVSASGTPAEVRGHLSEQFKGPLAEKPAGLSDNGERETVKLVHEVIEQVLTHIRTRKEGYDFRQRPHGARKLGGQDGVLPER